MTLNVALVWCTQLRLMGQLELNSSNREDILSEAARVRKSRFLRVLVQQYLGVHSPQMTAQIH